MAKVIKMSDQRNNGEPIFSIDEVPLQARLRWFLRRGNIICFDRGFQSKSQASIWIDSFRQRLDWRAGFTFRLRGDSVDMCIVDHSGNRAGLKQRT